MPIYCKNSKFAICFMRFVPAGIEGAWLINLEKIVDHRGWFMRTLDIRQLSITGIDFSIVQSSNSYNEYAGTLRGLHYQTAPHGEAKLVRCLRGAMFDVFVDLRVSSPTYCRWEAFNLSENDGKVLYIPSGCAHGYLTMLNGTQVEYQMDTEYFPESQRGIRWDDPLFAIHWPNIPGKEILISERDRLFQNFRP